MPITHEPFPLYIKYTYCKITMKALCEVTKLMFITSSVFAITKLKVQIYC